jgi:enoyl-CoA hydratase/carnithine racemase
LFHLAHVDKGVPAFTLFLAGLVPDGGALERLPRLVGRLRALEIVLSGDDFDADIADRYGWVDRTLDDDGLDSFVDTLVRRLASFDREPLAAAKGQINRFPTGR